MKKQTVYETIYSRETSRLLGEIQLLDHYRLAHWQNSYDQVSYHADREHTFSVYTKSGETTRRLDRNCGHAKRDSICLIPVGQESEWLITTPFEFTHLYFSDLQFKQFVTMNYDLEPRLLAVPDLTYAEDPYLQHLGSQLARTATVPATHLYLEQLVGEILARLVGISANRRLKTSLSGDRLKGGLSGLVRKRVVDFVKTSLAEKIRLNDLANLADLSEFHFARAFKMSTGLTPSDFITTCRVDQAKDQLKQDIRLIDIASNCGFGSQSHMTRIFTNRVGVSPGRYRSLTKDT